MKSNLLRTLLFLTIPIVSFSQNHWVQADSSHWTTSPRFLNDGNGNYSLVSVSGTGTGEMQLEEKTVSTPNLTITNSNATGNYDIKNSTQMSYFMYNGLRTVAYYNTDGQIIIAQCNAGDNVFNTLTSFTPTNLGTFSIDINPTTNRIYIACSNGNNVDIWYYDPSTMSSTTAITGITPSGGDYPYVNPKIHFNGDTLFLAGIDESISGMLVYKGHYNDIASMTIISIASNPQNVDSYAMCGETGQNPYFVGFSNMNSNLIMSSYNNGSINQIGASTNVINISSIGLDMTINNGIIEVVASTDDGNGSGDVMPFKWNGNTLLPIINSSIFSYITGDPEATRQTISQTSNGRTFVTFDTGLYYDGYLYATNNTPTVLSGSTPNSLCVYMNSIVFDNLTFQDLDGDSVIITNISSDNPNVISDGIGNYTITPGSSTATTNSYKIQTYSYQDGNANITIHYTDGYDSDSITIYITSNPQPTPPIQTTNINICSNSTEFNLNPFVSPYTGVWTFNYDTIIGGIFDPSIITASEQGETPVDFTFIDGTTGCTNDYYFYINVVIPPTATVTTTNADCGNYNGTATVDTLSGDAPINSIKWTTGDDDSLIVTGLPSGQYFVTVGDTNNCHVTEPANVGINGVNITANTANMNCYGGNEGFIHLTVTGPDAPYTYLWSNGKSTLNIDNLVAGTYDVVITSSTGCETAKTYYITQPDAITFPQGYYANQSSCGNSDGTIYINAIEGGTGAYTFLWNNLETTQNNVNIAAGFYNVTVKDANGCTTQLNCTIGDYNAPYVEAEEMTQPSCNQSNGEIVVDLYNITDPVQSISWSNGSNSMTNSNLSAGTYNCLVTTTTGCKGYGNFELTVKAPLQNNICMLTVDSTTTTNLVVWEKVENNVDHYNIYREGSTANQYMLIDTVSGLNHSIFNDVVASPKSRSWRYKISAVNQCGVEGPLSIHHKTVHLVISEIVDSVYSIVWDQYEGIDYSNEVLWRHTNVNGWEIVNTFPSTTFSFQDTIHVDATGIDYMIEITPASPCSPDKAQDYNSSRSNKANSIFDPGHGTGVSNNSIAQHTAELPILMYPNPSNGLITFVNGNDGQTDVIIYDESGKLLDNFSFEKEMQKNCQNLNAGVYYIRFTQNNSTTIKKMIIH